MKMFLLSDNRDTLTGMRLAGVEGKVIKERHEFLKSWREVIQDNEVGVLLITERLAVEFEEFISAVKAREQWPIITSIPDRFGGIKVGDFISKYIREAIGINN